MNIVISATVVVISSSRGAGQQLGEMLGQFEYHEDKGYYVQTSTEQSDEQFQAVYLSRDRDDLWNVGEIPGGRGYLWNPDSWRFNTSELPTSGWWYTDGREWIDDDDSLTVTPGPFPPLPRHFLVIAKGAAE